MNSFGLSGNKPPRDNALKRMESLVLDTEKRKVGLFLANLQNSGFFSWYHLEDFIQNHKDSPEFQNELLNWLRELFGISVNLASKNNFMETNKIKDELRNMLDSQLAADIISSLYYSGKI